MGDSPYLFTFFINKLLTFMPKYLVEYIFFLNFAERILTIIPMTVKLRLLYLLMLLAIGHTSMIFASERTFQEIKASDGLADNSAQTIKCTFSGRIVVTTLGNINFFDGVQFSHISPQGEEIYPLSNYHGHYHIYFDNVHHFWLKSSKGVSCVNLTKEQYISNIDSVFKSLGMKEPVTDMFTDSIGTVWMMGKNHLFNSKNNKRFPVLREANLQDLEVVNGKELLLFYGNGEVIGFDVNTEHVLFRNQAYGPEDAAKYYRSCVMTRYHNHFYQIRNGEKSSILLRFDLKSRQWSEVTRLDYHMNNMVIYKDVIYIASEYGYWTYDIKNDKLEHEETLLLVNGQRLLTDMNAIEFDKQGGMWIGTEKRGLLYSRQLISPFKKLSWENPLALKYGEMMKHLNTNIISAEFKEKKANCMFTDSRNWTWVGTNTGLYIYKNPKAEPICITRHEGLLNNVVHSIIEDNSHHVWVSTSYGISCVFIRNGNVRLVISYNTQDNVPNESFVNGHVMKLDDGTIVMQALDHVVTFNPDDFRKLHYDQTIKLYPKLIKLLVNGYEAEPDKPINGHVVLDRAVARAKEIKLNYNQNNISMTFSGLNYVRPLQTYYRVRVKGMIDQWTVYSYFDSGKVDKDGRLHLPLMGLKPSTYKVEVQVSMYPDRWDTEPYIWTLVVSEPWWRASGMYILLGIVLLTLLIANFIYYNRNTRLRIERKNSEGDIIRRIRNFVERTNDMENMELSITRDEILGSNESGGALSEKFIDIMLDIVPYVKEHRDVTMKNLCDITNVSMLELYDAISSDLYKNPRQLILASRLNKASEMLSKGDKSVEQVARECGFSTPNYFIACFFHKYKKTPSAYAKR